MLRDCPVGRLNRLTNPINEAQVADGAGELDQSRMGVELMLETDEQLTESRESHVRALVHPAMTPKAFTALDTSPCDAALDARLA